MFLFEKLRIYQQALAFAEQVSTLTGSFARRNWYLADQLNRASLSIALNIAEGNGRRTEADRRNFFILTRGSAHECVPLLELCRRKGLITDPAHTELKHSVETMAKMLSGLIERGDGKQLRRQRNRLAAEAAKLDPAEEQRLAEEGLGDAPRPEY